MPVAAAIAGAAVIGGATSLIAGSKAAKAQKNAASQSIAEQQREYDQSRADLAPYRATGTAALSKLASMYGVQGGNGTVPNGDALKNDPYGGYTESPGYAFQRDQGIQAAERAAAAAGRLASGGTSKSIARYVTGLAANDYDQYANRLAQLAGVGQSATNSTVAAGQNATNQITQAQTNAGNARASSYANTGSGINGTVNNLASAYLYSKGGYGAGSGGTNAYYAPGGGGYTQGGSDLGWLDQPLNTSVNTSIAGL